jgi:hypothetical protein
MKYFLEYTLGWRGASNKKAEKGTIVHKVLEIMGEIQVQRQNKSKRKTFDDKAMGRVPIYTDPVDVDKLTQKAYNFYTERSPNAWDDIADYRECRRWVEKAITYNEGEYNPLNCELVAAEQSFDFSVEKPWAMYNYDLPSGENLEGFLGLKGTIDQISKIDDNTYMILDWKTGRRLNWATGEEKTYEKLQSDHQLMMYYYAAQHLYPEIEHIMVTIYFINDGGPFTICFSKEDIPRIERMLQKKFEDIKATEIPRKNRSWKCSKFCHYGTNSFSDTHVKVIQERRPGQVVPEGQPMTMCEQTDYCMGHRPMNSVIKHMSAPGHDIDYYHSPGEAD